MAKHTKIQWSHSTVNPGMGCDGCELLSSPAALITALTAKILENQHGSESADMRAKVELVIGDLKTTQVTREQNVIVARIIKAVKGEDALAAKLIEVIKGSTTCYAAQLHIRWGRDNSGYAKVFEQPELFPGRMAEAARWQPLGGTLCPDKPWLDDCLRLIFVSDMGDVLSRGIPFEFLKTEIADVVRSENGRRHIWLWLTKRPERMAQFAKYLAGAGIEWPANLVAMTSITSRKSLGRVKALCKVPAKIRALSVEPLWEAVVLPLEGIHFVIVGGESGSRRAKPFDLAWARALRDQCRAAGVPFFLKQLGSNPIENGVPLKLKDSHGGDWEEWPEDLRIREVPTAFKP